MQASVFVHFIEPVLRRALHACSFGVVMHEVVSGTSADRRALLPLRHVLCGCQ